MIDVVRQYRWLRASAYLTGVAVFGFVALASRLLWPVVQRMFMPTRLSCGCGIVAVQQPWWLEAGAIFMMLVSAYILCRFVVRFIQQGFRHTAFRRQLLRLGGRRLWHHGAGVAYVQLYSASPFAVTVGWWRPEIVVADSLVARLTATELTAVLRHEQTHVQSFDPLMTALLDALAAALHWFPGTKAWLEQGYSLRELAADAGATDGYQRTQALAGAFVKLHDIAQAPLVSAFSPNRDRLEKLLNPTWRFPFRWWRLSAVIGVAMLATLPLIAARYAQAANSTTPAVAQACKQTIVMCAQPHTQTPTTTLSCVVNRCIMVSHPLSSLYGQSQE